MGAAADRTTDSDTQSGPTTAFQRVEANMALTAGDFAADAEQFLDIFRDGTDSNDTLVGPIAVFTILLEYSDA